ncbi:C-C motif chemokine 13-like [Pungitius pungitius]|uniref:C-C motif chemokine 13-like n=1 Tax=Pungitius pungitius TaxID=134920 RepID=UPI002E119EDD
MKTLVPLCLLLCVLESLSAAPAALSMMEVECCLQHNKIHVPKNKVIHIKMTSGDCPLKAIIITTEKRKFCIDPELISAKRQLAAFQKRLGTTTAGTSRPRNVMTSSSFVRRDATQSTTIHR